MTQQLTPTQTLSDTWSIAVEALRGFGPFFQEATLTAMHRAPAHWFCIVIAAANDPQPITVEQVHAIFPYNRRHQLHEALQPLVEGGYLEAVGGANGARAYRVTPAGRALIQSFYDAAHDSLHGFMPLPPAQLQELRDLLRAIVLSAQSPLPETESIFHVGRFSDPGPGGSLSAQIDQYLTDLYYFRDDAHVAAWRPTALDGLAFEALTTIWREQAFTAAELNQRLANRRLSADDYAAALPQLEARGLITLEGDRATLTPDGRALREKVEERTDDVFFAPWQALDTAQRDRLHTLLEQLRAAQREAARLRMWPLVDSVAKALQKVVQADVFAALQELIDPPVLFNHMRMAREAHPQPYTLQRFLTRFPYASPHLASERLQKIVAEGYMREEDGHFTLTEKGAAAVDAINDHFYTALGRVEALPAEQMARLNALLRRLVEAALNSDAPSTDRLRQTHDTARPRDYAPLARLDLNIDDLNAFRDDAHTSAWAAHFASGRDWETLTFVWREEAHTAGELATKLAFRGWDQSAYQSSLDALVQRGWLQELDGVYRVTPTGDALRRRVEHDTDALFYAVWDQTLTPQEENELRTLLIRLKVHLQALLSRQEDAT